MPDVKRVQCLEVLPGLRHPALVGRHHEHDGGHRPDPGEHVRHEPLMPGHVDERHRRPGGQGRPGEPEVDGHPPPALLRPPVGLHPGQRPYQSGLAVVDVTCGGYDMHASTAPRTAASCSAGSARRSSRQRPRSTLPSTGGLPARNGAAKRSGRLTAALSSVTPGAPPPPTVACDATAVASTPSAVSAAAITAARRCSEPGSAARAAVVGVIGPCRVASSAARVSLSTRNARASGCRRNWVTSSAEPNSSPTCGPPSSLSPLAVTRSAPWVSTVAASGSSGSTGCDASRPEPMSATTGTPSPVSCATGTDEVNPVMRKLDGCTLRTNPVCGPMAAA